MFSLRVYGALLKLLRVFNGKLEWYDRALIYSFLYNRNYFFSYNENILINDIKERISCLKNYESSLYSFLSIILFYCNNNNSAHYIPSFEDKVIFKLYIVLYRLKERKKNITFGSEDRHLHCFVYDNYLENCWDDINDFRGEVLLS